MKDTKIEDLLNKIAITENYEMQNQKTEAEIIEYRKLILYMMNDLKLINQPISNRKIFALTKFGNEVMETGGWLKYVELEKIAKDRKEKKEYFELRMTKWKYHTFWWFFGLACFGGLYSAYDIIDKLRTNKGEIGAEERTAIPILNKADSIHVNRNKDTMLH